MSDFLFEIGLEEVPARMLAGAQAELLKRTVALLERERLLNADASAATSYSTPRRLAVLIPGVKARQEDLTEDLLGPAAKIAYKDGVPTPAAHAFARKAGVPVEQLRTVPTPKGDYLAATSTKPGRTAAEILAADLPKEIAAIYWAKNMYWRAGKPERFVRPVRWLVALLDAAVVPVEFGGATASNLTYGHRILHGDAASVIESPTSYVAQLTEAHVMADVELRRHTIRKALDRVCRTLPNTRWREDHSLVDKMTHLTEWPSVLAGDFDAAYLTLPEEVLVTVMRDHQNYFAVETKDSKLAPHFLAVLNTAPTPEAEAIIRHGNARVLRARFNDARFFWDFDQRTPLLDRRDLLKLVVFQKELGTYWEKAEHVLLIVRHLKVRSMQGGLQVDSSLENALDRAALIAKTDLTTELVKEFTELQGQIGGLYAKAQGLGEEIAEMLYWQYEPKSAADPIPPSVGSQLLSLADRANTVIDMIAIGNMPTGSKDPFAIRRTANGIIRILAEGALPLSVSDVHDAAILCSRFARVESTAEHCAAFLRERVEFYLRDSRGNAYDVVKAVVSVGWSDVKDAAARAEAVTAARTSPEFEAVTAALKRMGNILAQAAEKGFTPAASVDPSLYTPGAETLFATQAQTLSAQVAGFRAQADYKAALDAMATLRPSVDAFFDAVMIMDPDERVRANRLALLTATLAGFGGIADFSEIVTAG